MLLSLTVSYAQNYQKNWNKFKSSEYKDIYIEEYEAYAALLVESNELSALDGIEFTIKGYHIPVMEDDLVVLSKYPNANCFFCGGAGMESIMEIRIKDGKPRHFEMDEKLTFRGTLKVNTTDYEILSFILEDAVLIDD